MGERDVGLYAPDREIAALYARIEDLCRRAEQGSATATPFLTPREAKYAVRQLSARISGGLAIPWGGYPSAERVRILLLPDYVEGLLPPAEDAERSSPAERLQAAGFDELADEASAATTALSIRGSGFRALSHRDYMGAILGLGLERDTLGDILPSEDGHGALLFCTARVADFLTSELHQIGSDTVRVCRPDPSSLQIPPRRVQPLQDTVASERLDCVVAALCGLSRERAQACIREGLCELDYEVVRECDRLVEPPSVLSLRGHGKFRVLPFAGENRHGRLRLVAERYL